jgi:phosphoglycolate phosphatase
MKTSKAMLFDLDGTLLDSAPDLVGSLNWVRQTEGLPPLPLSEMSQYASRGAIGLLKQGMPEADEVTLETWRTRFLEHYAVNSYRHSSLYDGVPELLEALAEAEIPWGLVTNKPEYLTHPIIEAANLGNGISCVVCGDTLSQSKPHPAPVSLACGILQTIPAEVLFVGDDIRDIQAGKAAGTQTAAAHYGYGSGELKGDLVNDSLQLHHPAELIDLVRHMQTTAA